MLVMSPGMHSRVTSPRAMTVMERGMWPTGTCSGSSCTRSSWYLVNLLPRVCIMMRPVTPLVVHCWLWHLVSGRNVFWGTSWYSSLPHSSLQGRRMVKV